MSVHEIAIKGWQDSRPPLDGEGPLAQQGERRDGIAKVAGSTPARSTSFKFHPSGSGAHLMPAGWRRESVSVGIQPAGTFFRSARMGKGWHGCGCRKAETAHQGSTPWHADVRDAGHLPHPGSHQVVMR